MYDGSVVGSANIGETANRRTMDPSGRVHVVTHVASEVELQGVHVCRPEPLPTKPMAMGVWPGDTRADSEDPVPRSFTVHEAG
jgi:hypothetical protein